MDKDGWDTYAAEQLGHIKAALIGGGSLQQRLTWAAVDRVAFLEPRMVPETHREALQGIHDRLTTVVPAGDEGAFAASIAAMSEDEREELAGDLHRLWFDCQRAWAD